MCLQNTTYMLLDQKKHAASFRLEENSEKIELLSLVYEVWGFASKQSLSYACHLHDRSCEHLLEHFEVPTFINLLRKTSFWKLKLCSLAVLSLFSHSSVLACQTLLPSMSRETGVGEFVQHHGTDWTSLAGKNSWTTTTFQSLGYFILCHLKSVCKAQQCGTRHPAGSGCFSCLEGFFQLPSPTSKAFQRVWNFPCRREICLFPQTCSFQKCITLCKSCAKYRFMEIGLVVQAYGAFSISF